MAWLSLLPSVEHFHGNTVILGELAWRLGRRLAMVMRQCGRLAGLTRGCAPCRAIKAGSVRKHRVQLRRQKGHSSHSLAGTGRY